MATWGRAAAGVLRNFLRGARGGPPPRHAVMRGRRGGAVVVVGSLVGTTGLIYCYDQNANRTALPFAVVHAEEEHKAAGASQSARTMKIAVLGATGQTGQRLVELALQQGHEVTAIVRNPGKLTAQHDKLKVVSGDIFSAEGLKVHIEGHDVVMSCLGFPPSFFSGVTGYTESMSAVVKAMREANVKRVIAMTSYFTEPNSAAQASYTIRFILLPIIRSILNNMYEMERYLSDTQDIDWTVVRPPGLMDQPATDKEFQTHEGYYFPDASGKPLSARMARGDVARFMLSQVDSDAWLKKGVAIYAP